MATPSQAQLADEKSSIQQEIQDLQAQRQEYIAKGKVNAAAELEADIAKKQGTVQDLDNKINNYSTFSQERAAQDAEIKATQNFEAKQDPKNYPIQTQTSVTESVTGGGAQITKRAVEVDTPTSIALKQQADATSREAGLYSNFAQRPGGTLDKKLANGEISQEKYDEIKSLTPDQRAEKAAALKAESTKLNDQSNAAKIEVTPGTTETIPGATETSPPIDKVQSDAAVKAEEIKTTVPAGDDPAINQAVATTVDNPQTDPAVVSEDAQANQNDQNQTDATTVSEPLQEPPGVEYDEFGGVDAQVAANENALQEPPQLTDEEVNSYLQETAPPEYGEAEPPTIDQGEDPYVSNGQSTIPPVLNDGANQDTSTRGLVKGAQEGAIGQSQNNLANPDDWRVRISIANGLRSLYNDGDSKSILAPLAVTDGVIFPYTPQVQTSYNANYDAFEPTHSNYKIYQYRNSSVGEVTITGDFTAQDTAEANYLLAVIHFFRSATKMFYGQDSLKGGVKNGTPPPICYLHGFGQYHFDGKPMVISNFSMTYPNEVDYIRAGTPSNSGGQNMSSFVKQNTLTSYIPGLSRLLGAGLSNVKTGELPAFQTQRVKNPTYVPTKVQITVTCLPIVTRRDVSNKFSLRDYASGKLITRQGGGFW